MYRNDYFGDARDGELLKILDRVAYTCASRYCGAYVVTISVDKVTFKQPIFIGELVTFLASVNYTGKTSLEVGIKVIAEDIKKRMVRHSNTSYFTMIAMDEEGNKVKVPPLIIKNDVQKDRFEKAKMRRLKRLETN